MLPRSGLANVCGEGAASLARLGEVVSEVIDNLGIEEVMVIFLGG